PRRERGVAWAVRGAACAHRCARAAARGAARHGARCARPPATLRRSGRDRGARRTAAAPRGLSRAGAFLARRAVRSRVVARGRGARRGGPVNPIVAVAVLAALWPFGRDRDGPVTIESLEERSVEIDVSTPIPASEEKAIESYRRFLELAADDPLLRPEAMRRLADLEIESAEIESTAGEPSTRLDDSIALYLELLEGHPGYAKNDLVLYQLARAYEARGDVESALATLDRLVAEHPRTVH